MQINEYSNPVQNTLEQYVPLPLQQMYQAASAIQQRGDQTQAQNDQFQTGVASMEALAPAQKDYVNKFANDFKSQQSALADKYNNNYADPQYIADSRKLNMQFAADPKLQIIRQTNDLYKKKENLKDELLAKGIKYIDSNPNFTGIDSQGNLLSDPGHLQATNFDNSIDQGFRDKAQIMTDAGNYKTNHPALSNERTTRLNGFKNGTDKDMMDAYHYYLQQGAGDLQARAQTISLLDKGMGFEKKEENTGKESLGLQYAEFNYRKQKDAADLAEKAREADLKAKGKGPNGFGEITSSQTPILTNYLNKDKIDLLGRTMDDLNPAGGIKKQTFEVPDTPENRTKYPKATLVFTPTNVGAALSGVNVTGQNTGAKLQVSTNTYDSNQSKLVDEARDMLGAKAKNNNGAWLSDKNVLNQYRQVLSNSQAESLSYAVPENDKYSAALTKLQFGSNGEKLGHDFVLVTKDGTFKSGSKEAEEIMGGVKHISATGVNASPVGEYPNGSIRGSAMQEIKDGSDKVIGSRPVTIIKPMDDNTQSQYRFANIGARAKESTLTNDQLRSGKEGAEFRLPAKNGGYLVPQKGVTSSNRLGVHFVHTDEKGNILNDISPISLDEIMNEAHSSYYSRLGASIDDKAEKQNYTTPEE